MNMREAFEKWAIDELMDGDDDPFNLRKYQNGVYKDRTLEFAYRSAKWASEWQKQKDAEIAERTFSEESDYWLIGHNIGQAILNQGDK